MGEQGREEDGDYDLPSEAQQAVQQSQFGPTSAPPVVLAQPVQKKPGPKKEFQEAAEEQLREGRRSALGLSKAWDEDSSEVSRNNSRRKSKRSSRRSQDEK